MQMSVTLFEIKVYLIVSCITKVHLKDRVFASQSLGLFEVLLTEMKQARLRSANMFRHIK